MGIEKRDEDRSPTGCHWQFQRDTCAIQVCLHCSRNWGNSAGSLNHHELDSMYLDTFIFVCPGTKGLRRLLFSRPPVAPPNLPWKLHWLRSDSHRGDVKSENRPFRAYEWITNHETWCFSFFFSFSFVSRRGVFERNESVWNDSEKKQTGKNGRCNFFFFFFLLQRKSNGDRIGNRFSRLRVRGDVTRALRNFLKDFGYFANYYYTRDVIFA